MKKIFLVIIPILFLISITSSIPDEALRRNVITARNTLQTDLYFVWRDDTINFTNIIDSLVVLQKDSNDVYVTHKALMDSILNSAGGHAPLTLGDSAIANGFSLDVQELEFNYSNFLFKDIYDLDNDSIIDNSEKLKGKTISETAYGETWNGSDSIPNQGTIYAKFEGVSGNVKSITLPYASTVIGRIALATEGTDYPTGWVLTADGLHLIVTHNLGRWATSAAVWGKTGGTVRQQFFDKNAFDGFYSMSDDQCKITSLSVKPLDLVVYITFE